MIVMYDSDFEPSCKYRDNYNIKNSADKKYLIDFSAETL